MTQQKSASLQGQLMLLDNSRRHFAAEQIVLLQAIDQCGSISAAARQVGISYKTAWDRIDAMNNMVDQPLVLRTAGGSGGGGTQLTELGRQTILGFQRLQEVHEVFIQRLGSSVNSLSDLAGFIRSGSMLSSAQNQFRGRVSQLIPGAVNTEVHIALAENQQLVAMISHESCQQMALQPGDYVMALINSSWIILSTDSAVRSSARNQLSGRISRIVKGSVNSEISLDLGGGKTLAVQVTNASMEQLRLSEGVEACALFKASSIILLAD